MNFVPISRDVFDDGYMFIDIIWHGPGESKGWGIYQMGTKVLLFEVIAAVCKVNGNQKSADEILLLSPCADHDDFVGFTVEKDGNANRCFSSLICKKIGGGVGWLAQREGASRGTLAAVSGTA